MDHPFQGVTTHWLKKIKLAQDFKRAEFQDDADEAMKFFDGPYQFMYGLKEQKGGFAFVGDATRMPQLRFAMTVNKVAEMVQLFGPVLYHRNPVRQCNPRMVPFAPPDLFGLTGAAPADPMQAMQQQMAMQQYQMVQMQVQQQRNIDTARASLLQQYQNYTPEALDLKTESRWAIDEAIIKGLGLLWTEVYTPPGAGTKMVGNFFGSVDELNIDSDAELRRDAMWVSRRCIHPVWKVEREYGYAAGSLKGYGHLESHHQQAGIEADPVLAYRRQKGETNDLMVYHKIYSKMGVGGRLAGANPADREALEVFGDYVYLVVADGVPWPLNLPHDLFEAGDLNAIAQRLQWPTPFWADDGWPFVPFEFHSRPRKVWPMSHLKPGMGELKFINWVYSFVAGKIYQTCRDFIAMKKSLGEEIRTAILSGKDLELLELEEHHGTITDVIGFLQHPEFNGDIWKVLEAVEANFEKRVGLTELMYGQTASQLRSAEEARIKSSQIAVRPDDMANKIEEAMTLAARMEALAARWHLTGKDVEPVLGPIGGQMWDQLVTAADPAAILHQLEYRIEAGSARKPNKEGAIANMTQAIQTLFQPLYQYAMTSGNVGPVNALIEQWCKANDIEPGPFLLTPPPPPPPVPGEGGEGAAPSGGQAA